MPQKVIGVGDDEGSRFPLDTIMRYKIQHEHYEKNPLQLEPEEEEEKCTCIKVLVVDDYGFNITCLKVMLEKWNLDIHVASNGE